MLSLALLKELLEKFGVPLVPVELKKRMLGSVPKIAAKMEKNGVTPATATAKVVVREALYHLWHEVIPSGFVADKFRDAQDSRVVEMVGALPAGTTTAAAVHKTLDCLLEVTF